MFTPERMHFLSLIFLKDDLSKVSEILSEEGVLHIEKSSYQGEGSRIFNEIDNKEVIESQLNPLIRRIQGLQDDFDLKKDVKISEKPTFSLDYYKKIQNELDSVAHKFKSVSNEMERLEGKIDDLERLSWELELLEERDVPLEVFQETLFISVAAGFLPTHQVQSLKSAFKKISSQITYQTHGTEAFVMCVCLKENKGEMKEILNGFNFNHIDVPDTGSIPEVLEENDVQVWSIRDQIADLKKRLNDLRNEYEEDLAHWLTELKLHRRLLYAMENFLESENEYFISGWLPESKVESAHRRFSKDLENDIVFETTPTEKLEEQESPQPPTKFKNPWFLRPFESLVKIYGIPTYKGIDPTFFLAITFVLMFGMMFGDIGHGSCLTLAGLALLLWKPTQSIKNFGYIFLWTGLSAIGFGFLFGSFFGNEELIQAIWFTPMEDPGRLLTVGIIIGIGAVNLGIILNVIKCFIQKEYKEAFLGEWGIVSTIFFWELLALGYLGFTRQSFQPPLAIVAPLLLIPLLVLGFGDIIINRITGEREEGGIVENIFKPAEVSLSLLTNTISFIRVGAFSLNHAALLGAVFLIAEIMGGNTTGMETSAIITGNIFVFLLEGLVVFIQALRLEYYEFFSKFFTEHGKEFNPLTLQQGRS